MTMMMMMMMMMHLLCRNVTKLSLPSLWVRFTVNSLHDATAAEGHVCEYVNNWWELIEYDAEAQ
jgi:uncharacterized protein YqiB (DUF1249 family)